MAEERVVVVAASPADLDAITSLEATSFESPWRRAFFESELNAAGRYNRVARLSGGEFAGYLFSMYFLDEMHVNKIAVAEPRRRGGVGMALMSDCVGFARRHAVRSISLEVRESNLGAQRFYEFLGFRAAYVRRGYYPEGESAVVMTVEL
jgi:[ribosomal protein S18]-alanine N-acetyltransferase